MRYTFRAKLITRVTKGVFILFRSVYVLTNFRCDVVGVGGDIRVSGTIGATNMATSFACFTTCGEHYIALVTCPSNALTRLLVNQILTPRLAGSLENNVLVFGAIVGNYRRVLFVGLDESRPFLTAGKHLGLGALRRVAGTLGAAMVLAAGALLVGRKDSVALVASSSDSHANRLVHAEDSVVGRGSVPF